MNDLEVNVLQLNELIIRGQTIKAIELFYSDNVIVQENEDEPRIGKQICLSNERRNIENIIEVKNILLNQAIDLKTNVVFSEWEIVFTTKGQKCLRLNEVSVQNWMNGKISKEKFYYKEFYPVISN